KKEKPMAVDQLSGLDTAFLCLDSPSTPMNMGALVIFTPRSPMHPTRIVELVRERAARVPRLRQRVRSPLFPLGAARWSEDPSFDVTEHVIAHHLPRPHDDSQLTGYASAAMAERLDPTRPLWEIHVITGLAGGRFALLAKLHHALADGAGA